MNCEYVHTWLMQVESLLVKDWPRDMNRHLKSCVGCAQLARNLFKVEQAWREQPVPEGCDKAKTKFLKSISTPAKPIKTEALVSCEREPEPATFEIPKSRTFTSGDPSARCARKRFATK